MLDGESAPFPQPVPVLGTEDEQPHQRCHEELQRLPGTSKKPVYRQPLSRTALPRDVVNSRLRAPAHRRSTCARLVKSPSCIVAPAGQVIGQSPSGSLHIGDRKAHGS